MAAISALRHMVRLPAHETQSVKKVTDYCLTISHTSLKQVSKADSKTFTSIIIITTMGL
jgi:hypothetical protein